MRVVSDDSEAHGDPEAIPTPLRTGRLRDQSEPADTVRPYTAHNAKAWDALPAQYKQVMETAGAECWH